LLTDVWQSVSHAFLNFHQVLNFWVRGNAVKANQIDFPEMKSYASIDELLADEVDLVIVNTSRDALRIR
jgi:hypothetical protein